MNENFSNEDRQGFRTFWSPTTELMLLRRLEDLIEPLVALMARSSHDPFEPVLALRPIGQDTVQKLEEL